MKDNLVKISLLVILSSFGFSNFSFGQDTQTSGGVDIDGSWYLGEGLKKGDYFEYSLCEINLNDCSPITLKMWIKGDIQNISETLWDAKVVVEDQNKIIIGSLGLGKTAPEPILFDDNIFEYTSAFKSSLAWLSAFTTGNENDRIHGPKEFRSASWGEIGPIGGGSNAQLITNRVETITTPAGTVDTIVVGWYSGNDNEIWLVDDFPFPVKALTYAGITEGNAPIMYQFTLLNYKENIMDDPFKDVEETIQKEELLNCPTKFYDYTSDRVSTNTHSMMIQYNYSPLTPIEGCNIDWKINFLSKYNDLEILDQIHYDIWVVDEEGNKLRSYAQEIGEDNLYNEFGRVHHLLQIKEKAGLVRYSIFVHGTGPEQEKPDASMSGFAIVEIEIEENPLLEKLSENVVSSSIIPEWIKSNAGWWANGDIDDTTFVQGIQFLIKEGILNIP
ncbi:MAG TPA: peptidase [Nitrosopumilaceae archaeon]|nr:peptidase [Nitrosopumilaceae archaeon]